jgi:D-3-phosphoglycerate dehydrogenase
MARILVNDGIHPDGKKMMEEAGFTVSTTKIAQEDLINELPNFDAICVRSATKVRKDLIDACPNLKIVARGGVGMDNIDVDYARSKSIEVINTPAASSEAVAELAFGHIFNLSRFLHNSNREMNKGDFKSLKKSYAKGSQLRGKTLGVIGLGRIGQETARIGISLGMTVLPVDKMIDKASIKLKLGNGAADVSVDVDTVAMDDMLSKADYISVHVPFSGGKALIGTEEINKLKKGAILVNTARGGTFDEGALLAGLESGQLGGVGLDVFENEPNPLKELLNHPRISVSPHIGAATSEAQRNIGLELAEKIIKHLS